MYYHKINTRSIIYHLEMTPPSDQAPAHSAYILYLFPYFFQLALLECHAHRFIDLRDCNINMNTAKILEILFNIIIPLHIFTRAAFYKVPSSTEDKVGCCWVSSSNTPMHGTPWFSVRIGCVRYLK